MATPKKKNAASKKRASRQMAKKVSGSPRTRGATSGSAGARGEDSLSAGAKTAPKTARKTAGKPTAREKLSVLRPSGHFVRKTGPRKKVARLPDKSNVGRPSSELLRHAPPRQSFRPEHCSGLSLATFVPRLPSQGSVVANEPRVRSEDSFFDLVHEVARQIPRARVTSYGAIAAALGTRLSARMVGWAMNACHLSKRPVPAHRVVNSLGLLTGRHHFNPPEKMQQLLEKEGVAIKDNKVVEFKRLFWDPSQEL